MTLRNRREASSDLAEQLGLPEWMFDVLCCPVSGAELEFSDGPQGVEPVAAEEADPKLVYPICDGIPVPLEHEARQVD